MTDTPDTSPEAVERLDPEIHADKFDPSTGGYVVTFEKYADLSAERDEWKAAAQRHHPNPADFRYWEGRYRDEKARAEAAEKAYVEQFDKREAAETELAALKAELAGAKMHVAEMITAFEEHVALPDKNCSCHISPPCSDCTENDYARETLSEARAFLARHQKEADT